MEQLNTKGLKMPTKITIEQIKQQAKVLKKQNNIKHAEALNEIAKKYGFNKYEILKNKSDKNNGFIEVDQVAIEKTIAKIFLGGTGTGKSFELKKVLIEKLRNGVIEEDNLLFLLDEEYTFYSDSFPNAKFIFRGEYYKIIDSYETIVIDLVNGVSSELIELLNKMKPKNIFITFMKAREILNFIPEQLTNENFPDSDNYQFIDYIQNTKGCIVFDICL